MRPRGSKAARCRGPVPPLLVDGSARSLTRASLWWALLASASAAASGGARTAGLLLRQQQLQQQHGGQPLATSGLVVDGDGQGDSSVDMKEFVLQRAREQLIVAREAEAESEVSAKSVYAEQQRLVAEMAAEKAEEASRVDSEAIPQAKAALDETRAFAIEAQVHAERAQAALAAFKRLPEEAASAAVTAVRDSIRQAGYAAAEQANAAAQGGLRARHHQKVMTRVAEAMEPYHFAVVRTQKDLAISEAKARSAANAAERLAGKAQQLARSAQALQASGLSTQAMETMTLAHATADQGANLRAWALQLHSRAEQLQSAVQTWQTAEQQAAFYAAEHVPEEVIPPFPTRPAMVTTSAVPTAPPCL